MKTIFDKITRDEIIKRIDSLHPTDKPLWGKMTVEQMVRHCTKCEGYYFGDISIKRSLLGRLLGKIAINSILANEAAGLKKNSPTPAQFKIVAPIHDLETEKRSWKICIEKYADYNKDDHFDHWFFGRLTSEQLGQFVYKHDDHHLRQFGK